MKSIKFNRIKFSITFISISLLVIITTACSVFSYDNFYYGFVYINRFLLVIILGMIAVLGYFLWLANKLKIKELEKGVFMCAVFTAVVCALYLRYVVELFQ